MRPVLHRASDLKERGFQLLTPPVTFISFDPSGDGDDRDGLVGISREEHQRGEPHDPDFAVELVFRILMAHRLPRDLEFPDRLAAILSLDRQLKGWTRQGRQIKHFICVETNGVGFGYSSSLSSKTDTQIIPYVTVGNVNATRTPQVNAKVAMPRLQALNNVRILMETGYLTQVKNAPGAEMLEAEMNAFVWRGKNRPEAMTGQTDDLVMALTGALWIASQVVPPALKQAPVTTPKVNAGLDRMRIN